MSEKTNSINRILKDFEDENNPQYAACYLFFDRRLSEKNMKKLAACKGLVERAWEIVELNLSYMIYDENIFTFKRNTALALWIANLTETKNKIYISDIY